MVFFSWAYEITPEGIKREKEVALDASSREVTAHRLNRALLVIMAVALGYFAVDKFVFTGDAEPVPVTHQVGRDTPAAEVTPPESTIREDSIAVLPFVNMSSDPEQEYFSDGLTEELLNLLAGIEGLKVAARTSSFFYKDKLDAIPLSEVARQLEVAHILEGSVRKGGNQIRITAQLIQADDGFHLWSETWDRTLDDVFAIQDEIAAAVVDQLKITLLGDAPHARVLDPESYQLALQGRFLFNRRGAGDLTRALELFERAVELDPDNVLAWVGMTPLYLWLFDTPRMEAAVAAVDRALELDPEHPEALARKALTLMRSDREKEAWAVWDRALEHGRDNSLILSMQAGMHFRRGEIDQALEWQRRALAADPLNQVNISNTASYLLELGRWQEAQSYAEKFANIFPGSNRARELQAGIALQRGRPEECLAILEHLPPLAPDELVAVHDNERLSLRIMAQHALGNRAEAERLLAAYIEAEQQRVPMNVGFNTAAIYAFMGDADRAFEWVERGLELNPRPAVQHFLGWRFAGLFDDPRWQQVRDRFPDFQGWDQVRR